MSFVPVSSALKTKIQTCMLGDKSSIFYPVCTFYTSEGYRQQWRTLKSLIIAQDFVGAMGDVIQGTVTGTIDEFKELIQNTQDLYCSIVCYPMNTRTLMQATSSDQFILTGMVTLDFKEDLNKVLSANAFGMTDTATNTTTKSPDQEGAQIDITFHLIETDMYQLRNTQLNCILRDVTLEQVIHWIVERLGASSVSVITPDNTQTYNNLVIPPKTAQEIFSFLQERYGIYSKGMAHYFTSGKMYIYPPADQSSSTSPTEWVVHLVNVPENNYPGANSYHSINTTDKTIHVASITGSTTTSPGTTATENAGNIHLSLKADRIRDNLFTKSSDGTVTKLADAVTTLMLQNTAANMSANTQKVVYDTETSNPYVATSKMAETNATILQTGWAHAFPRLLEPGQTVYYHYDGDSGAYQVTTGRLQKVLYQSQTLRLGTNIWQPYICFNAALEVRLEPDYSSASETQTLNATT